MIGVDNESSPSSVLVVVALGEDDLEEDDDDGIVIQLDKYDILLRRGLVGGVSIVLAGGSCGGKAVTTSPRSYA